MDLAIKGFQILVRRRDELKEPELIGKTDKELMDMVWGPNTDIIAKMCMVLIWRRDDEKEPELAGKTDSELMDMAWEVYKSVKAERAEGEAGRSSVTPSEKP